MIRYSSKGCRSLVRAQPFFRGYGGVISPPPPTLLKSTEELYSTFSSTPGCVGAYARYRETLDYGWHGRYTPSRQSVQDGIIAGYLGEGMSSSSSSSTSSTATSSRPWLVYTAGAMGAGKSHTMRRLATWGAFPLQRFLCVDPDEIKGALPEAASYAAADPGRAGTLLHKESLLVADIVTRAAMARGHNVLVHGSMRNALWYGGEWARVRARDPHYRLAVILVTAPPGKVHQRATLRALKTGRDIPKGVIEDSITGAPHTFELLKNLADYATTFDNGGDVPCIVPPDTLNKFTKVWE